jgi:hypothetical protein
MKTIKEVINELNRMREKNDQDFQDGINGAEYTNGRQHQIQEILEFIEDET